MFSLIFLPLSILWTIPLSESANEQLLIAPVNAYNPIPSPDGKLIAFLRTGWDRGHTRYYFTGGFGRSNLRSDVMVMTSGGRLLTEERIADAFLAGWTPDGSALICYRDYGYSLVEPSGAVIHHGQRRPEEPERASFVPRLGRFVWVERGQSRSVIQSPEGPIAHSDSRLGSMIAPSPDGRFVAIGENGGTLHVYDTVGLSWANLGVMSIRS